MIDFLNIIWPFELIVQCGTHDKNAGLDLCISRQSGCSAIKAPQFMIKTDCNWLVVLMGYSLVNICRLLDRMGLSSFAWAMHFSYIFISPYPPIYLARYLKTYIVFTTSIYSEEMITFFWYVSIVLVFYVCNLWFNWNFFASILML